MKTKYPRTPHLPWSPGSTADDKVKVNISTFVDREVVVTEKLDGENTTLYRDALHARSLDGRHHPSRNWVKQFHGNIAYKIPEGYRCCGENLFARHSIAYDSLESYFYLFSVWTDANECLSWDDTVAFASDLGCATPQVLLRGEFDRKSIENLVVPVDEMEGYVVRIADAFHFDEFENNVAKWVRKNHVQTDQHWMHAPVVPNSLKDES